MTTISGIGCSLMDFLYTGIDFSSPAFARFRSRKNGDGGLVPGNLVFLEDFEKFALCSFSSVQQELLGSRKPDGANLGGPSIVSLINAAQLLGDSNYKVRFFGARGNDATGNQIMDIISHTTLDASGYQIVSGATSSTNVFSDPCYDGGHGERTFINNIGSSWNYRCTDVPSSFFDTDIAAFGGTGLVPHIHDGLASLLMKARNKGALTFVNTVYDFRNQARFPDRRWPLGESEDTYKYIDILVCDREEALRLSGEASTADALQWFISRGVSSAVITEGARNISLYSDGSIFAKKDPFVMPVCDDVTKDILANPEKKGDTTGCGDNFAGGLLASVASQMNAGIKRGKIDPGEACSWAVASGGFCCFYIGGTFTENYSGEKKSGIEKYYRLYKKQLEGKLS